MSSIFSELVADVVLERCGSATENDKYLIGSLLDVPAAELYIALAGRTNATCRVRTGTADSDHWDLQAVQLENQVMVLPYLVREQQDGGTDPNQGNRGFNGKLRDWFDRETADGEIRVLVTFDEDPIETQMTAMDGGLSQSALSTKALLDHLQVELAETASHGIRPLLERILAFIRSRDDLTAAQITRAVHELRLASSAGSEAAVGEQLVQLPWLLRDPGIEAGTAKTRLSRSEKHRSRVDSWAQAPDDDFEDEVRAHYDKTLADKLIASRRLGVVRWSEFTLTELQEGLRTTAVQPDKNRFDPATPLVVRGAAVSVLRLLEDAAPPHYSVVALVRSANLRVDVHLARALIDRETLHLVTYEQAGEDYVRAPVRRITAEQVPGQTEISFEIVANPLSGKWFFCDIVLTNSSSFVKRYLSKVSVGLLVDSEASALPYDAACNIDAASQRFVVSDEPVILVATPEGETEPAPDTDVVRSAENGAETEDLVITVSPEPVLVPVVYELVEDDEPPAETGEFSPEHAVLRFAAAENVPVGTIEPGRLAIAQGRATVATAGREAVILDVPDLGRSRWRIEAAMLSDPETTNYVVEGDGTLSADRALQELAMSAELARSFSSFLEARIAFFNRVRTEASGSRLTVLAARLPEMAEAESYVAAYADLLESVPDNVNWRAEYERILLVDSVRVGNGDEILVGPTSPLAVAFHTEIQRSLDKWADDSVENLSVRDVDLLVPRFALPLVRNGNNWYETRFTAYPWRAYMRRSQLEEARGEPFLATFVARRIEAFLKVHPLYRDQNRTLVLAFVNPSDGAHIRDALLQILKAAAKPREPLLDRVPQFEVKLFAGDESADDAAVERLGSELDRFMSITQESGAPGWLEQELMRRLTYTKGRLDEYIADPSAFSHLAFIQNYFRPGSLQAYDLTERPSTLYIGGLGADVERASEIHANDISFSSGVWLGQSPRDSHLKRIIGRSAEIVASASGNPVTANRGFGVLTTVLKADIPALYERAVWVVHLDRHIGLELFYPQAGTSGETPYILDHTDQENLQESGFDAITATTMVRPYLALIRSIFDRFVDGMDETRADRMLRWLNLLSGRWALQLLQETPTQIKERLGAVIAFRMLALRERIFDTEDTLFLVISLDELLRVTPKEGLALQEGWAAEFGHSGAASDDLLVLRVPLDFDERPVVHFRTIEVKYSEGAPPTDKAWEQLAQTHRLLELMFATRGPGRQFRGRVLAKLIRTYVSRLTSYGLLKTGVETDSRFVRALDSIGAGDFDFAPVFFRSGTAVVGDFMSIEPNYDEPVYEAEPYVPAEHSEPKIGRIRIGKDLIDALAADNEDEAQAGTYSAPSYDGPEGEPPEEDSSAQDDQPDAPTDGAGRGEQGTAGAGGVDESPTGDTLAGKTLPASGDGTAVPTETTRPEAEDRDAAPPGDTALLLRSRFAVPQTELLHLADRLDQVFARYSLPVQPFNPSLADAGPNVIRFRTRMLEAGTIGSIEARTRDINRELAIDEPVYIGQEPPYVVVDVPRPNRALISLDDVLPALDDHAEAAPGELPVVMGLDASGRIEIANLADMPHLLVAGSTGSGKSVFLSTLGACLARLPVSRLELVVVDIKGLDFAPFKLLPHTRGGAPIEDPDEAIATLESLMTDEVRRRREIFRESGARHIVEHYRSSAEDSWPRQIVVMIDEYAQLASASGTSKATLESLVQQYAQYARAFGIYLVLATQRPSVDVITGRIKANLPARCVFRLPSFNDSRTVIDTGGAEKLLGAGDMLFYRDGTIQRLQGVFTGPDDFRRMSERH
jgi:hypothetical protein